MFYCIAHPQDSVTLHLHPPHRRQQRDLLWDLRSPRQLGPDDGWGAQVLARESFTHLGARRGSTWSGTPSTADYTAFGNTTRKGFTGHEMLDSVSLVHMNGRVYDPYLGRFLSADTVVQSLTATQSINPYAYAWNDPLKYTDPSGHSLLGDIIGVIAALAVIGFAPVLGLPAIGSADFVVTAAVAGFVGGFVGAAISTGSLSAALTAGAIGAIAGAAFFEAGSFAKWAADGSKVWLYVDGVLAHAAVGCGATMLSGGNCGKGALSAAVAEAAGPLENSAAQWGGRAAGTVAAGIVGGLAARAVNGSFDDGFSVGAAGYLFNSLGHLLVGQDAHQVLLAYLQSRPVEGDLWDGNTALDGLFGGGKPDLLYGPLARGAMMVGRSNPWARVLTRLRNSKAICKRRARISVPATTP